MLKPIVLCPAELDLVLRLVNATNREYGAARICRVLASKHSVRTRSVNVSASVGNISDFVTKAINPRIKSIGLKIRCTKPPTPFHNRYDQSTNEFEWSFYRAAANDAEFGGDD
jgi:hypothetical protein